MPVRVYEFRDGGGEPCCVCFCLTSNWYRQKDVALCPECAKNTNADDVPTKREWIAEYKRRTNEG